ncbi:MAG: DUF2306 domain-containing protein, partial [Fulvivirga sp.]|nr:DUF2306 domain-containing protein [Fulvivirga sp.]
MSKSEMLLRNFGYRTAFYFHIAGGIIAMFTGPFQIKGFGKMHRVIGKIYYMSVLLSGFAAFAIAWQAFGGWIAKSGFVILAVYWIYATHIGVIKIRRGSVIGHK